MRPMHLQQYAEAMIRDGDPFCVTGRPGIGKTDIIMNAAAAADCEAMICHPVVDDPIDYKGLPSLVDNQAEFLPYGNLRAMMEASEPTLVFFDDLGQAPEAVQKALMQLLLSRTINGHRISGHIRFAAATNGKEHKSGVSGLLEPVKSRFDGIVELEFHLDDWKQWAFNHGVPAIVIAFADFRPSLMYDWKPTKDMVNSPQPRTMAKLGKRVERNLPEAIREDAYRGAIGDAGSEFYAFEAMANELPSPEAIFKDPANAQLPARDKPDVCYAVAGMLAQHATEDNISALFTYLDRWDNAMLSEYAVVCFKNLMMRDRELVKGREAMQWAARHRSLVA